MNDVTVSWKKLKKFKSRIRSVVEDIPCTKTTDKDADKSSDSCHFEVAWEDGENAADARIHLKI